MMTSVQVSQLHTLCETLAPTGRESAMSARMADGLRKWSPSVSVDWLGNVVASFGSGSPSLLFTAHMDEIGFVVREVMPDGFLRVERLGGVSRRGALATPVVVLGETGEVCGTVGIPSHHLTRADEQFVVPPVEAWYLDIGADSEDGARAMGVRVGSFAAYAPNFRELGGKKVASKSLDNRASCWVLLELARRFARKAPPATVHLLASVQEEFHLRGLIPAVRRVDPSLAVTLDITPAADTPDVLGRNPIRLGAGPTVKVMDFHGRGSLNGLIVPEFLIQWIEETARAASIRTQRDVLVGVVTEGTFLPSLDIPTAAVGVPTRYTHSPSEVVSLDDLDGLADLCEQMARRLPALEPPQSPKRLPA